LSGIVSLEPELAAQVANDVGFDRVYESLEALLDDATVNAVAVLVPPAAAHDVVTRVARKGVPLFSEKPPGISTAQATSLADAVTVPHVLAFNRRFAPLNNTFKALVEELDTITYVEGQFFRHNRREPEFMVGTGIHWINFMEYVCGEIETVVPQRIAGPACKTSRVAQFTFAGGIPGQLQVLPCTGADVERMIVHSPRRTLILHGPLWDQPGRIIVHDRSHEEIITPEARTPLPEIVRLGIVGEYVEFLTRACAGQPTRSTFRNAVNSMRVAEAMAA
jgi:predicted dehydrogenase